jgi:sec-independent protein translocase protein TatC
MGERTTSTCEMGFWDHVEELRQRILRSLVYVTLGAVAAWFYRSTLLRLLEYPALEGARRVGLEDFAFRIFEAAGGFMLMVQISLVAGVVLASPLLTIELWGFLAPALLPHEKRWATWAVPSATFLFLCGVATCYWIAPSAFAFFLRFNLTMGVKPELTLGPYLYFFLRLVLVFGVLFELPLFLMVLAGVGLVTSSGLIRQWRVAIVSVFLVAAIATPTGDAFTMTVLATPMMFLYLLSVFLVRMVEKKASRKQEEDSGQPPAPEAGGLPTDNLPPSPPMLPDESRPSSSAEGDASDLSFMSKDTSQPYSTTEADEEAIEEIYRELNEKIPPSLDQ